jgi:tRNA-specific 2-thiouridylase
MSGGVDSSVAAALLLERGHDVTGVTMQLWSGSDTDGGCCSVSAARDAKRVCDLLGIAHYTLNYRDLFEREVVAPYADEYASGRTPSPCIVCNDRVKFSDLLTRVSLQDAEHLATGHYARLVPDKTGAPMLARGIDPAKDQSYFLYRLTPEQRKRVLFPVGDLEKTAVRAFAKRIGLPVAAKPESQEACFAEFGPAEVLARLRPDALEPGPIVDRAGAVLGTHDGIGRYTVGQRKGLGLAGGPWFVLAIDAATRRITVGREGEDSTRTIIAEGALWWDKPDLEVTAQVRYRGEPLPARAHFDGGELHVEFSAPVRGVSPGQAVVCYLEDVVVGGGTIACTDS